MILFDSSLHGVASYCGFLGQLGASHNLVHVRIDGLGRLPTVQSELGIRPCARARVEVLQQLLLCSPVSGSTMVTESPLN
jgi:hypothetical protein